MDFFIFLNLHKKLSHIFPSFFFDSTAIFPLEVKPNSAVQMEAYTCLCLRKAKTIIKNYKTKNNQIKTLVKQVPSQNGPGQQSVPQEEITSLCSVCVVH